MILTIPCLFLSAAAARRVLQLHRKNQHSLFSFKNSTGPFHLGSQLSNEQTITSGRPVSPVVSPDNTSPASVDPETPHSTPPIGSGIDMEEAALYNEPDVSPSSPFGAFSSSHKRSETWEVLGTIEEDDESDPRRQIRSMMLSCKLHLSNRVWYKVLPLTLTISDARCATSEAQSRASHMAVNSVSNVSSQSLRLFWRGPLT